MSTQAGAAPAEHLSHLERLSLFEGLARDDIAHLAKAAQHRRVAGGELVMEAGCRGDGLHVVIRGELAVTRRDGAGEILLALVGPGTFVGEMSLVDDAPRSA
jgi:CRP/FNR family transcriptional regulator, cyclic AMP receptor protein